MSIQKFSFASKLRFTPRLRSGDAFDVEYVSDSPSQVTLRVKGSGANELFANESGGHRWQQVSPTGNGKLHSSTVTVAVLPEETTVEVQINDKDLEIKTCRGSGPGGQHKNVTDSCVVIRHKPSGEVVKCESERSQTQNKISAMEVLRSRLQIRLDEKQCGSRSQTRRKQVGSGMRADKIRTVQEQNGIVINHITGRKMPLKGYKKGDLRIGRNR